MTTSRMAGLQAVCAAVLVALPGQADSLQREGLPVVDGVTLLGVEDSKLQYRTAGGEREAELFEVVSLSIDSTPAFKDGLDAFQAGELRKAQRAFKGVWDQTQSDWIRHYAGFFLVQVYDQRSEPVDAAAVYTALAADSADLYFLSKLPTASLEKADDNQKARIVEQIAAVLADTKGKHRDLLRAYRAQVLGEEAPLPEVDGGRQAAATELEKLKADAAVLLPEAVWKMRARKGEPEGKWDAIDLLAKGDAEAAIKQLKPWLQSPGDLPEKLFLQARAQLMLADESGERDDYRDAGLTFMRIVVHFNRAGQAHALVAPATLEVAYIHEKIERQQIADKLLEEVFLAIDDQAAYPQYRKRYYQIIGEDVPEEEEQ